MTEGTTYEIEFALFPPGARECHVTNPSGLERDELYVPWIEWLTVSLIAAAAALAVAPSITSRGRAQLISGSLILFICGLAVWFIEPPPAVILLGLAVAIAVTFNVFRMEVGRRSSGSTAR